MKHSISIFKDTFYNVFLICERFVINADTVAFVFVLRLMSKIRVVSAVIFFKPYVRPSIDAVLR